MRRDREIEESVRWSHQPFAEERPADLEHQLVIVLKSELQDPLDGSHGPRTVSQLEQRLAQSGQSVLVIGIERERLLEAAPRPGVFLPSELGVGPADMQFNGVGVERDPSLRTVRASS